MPRKAARQWPADPRVAEQLDAPPEALGDGASWSGVEAGPESSVVGPVCEFEVVGSRLRLVRLTGAVLERGRLADAVLEDCELSGAVLDDTMVARVLFRRCRMSGLVATGLRAQDVRLVDCKIDGANFRGASLERCSFEGCDLRGADFYGATIDQGRLRNCVLSEVELSKADCPGLDLRGSDLQGVKGAGSLRGCLISPDQMVPLGLALLATLGVHLEPLDTEGA